ncbi:hypothetical protein ACQ4PT_044383 [Festuca glaucescens]
MSIVPKETIEVIAQSVGISNLPADVSAALAPDAEYRLRELMQEAIKCTRHAKRTVLTANDVDSALSLRNVESVYGFASDDPLWFKRDLGHMDLFYFDDREVDFKEIIEAPLPKAPLDAGVVAHWLAIKGVQPAIPENPPIDDMAMRIAITKSLKEILVRAFCDPHKALTQHYGAVQGISALGASAIRLLLLPKLETYMQLLDPELQLEKQTNEMKRKEAWRVYSALLCAAGKCLCERLKLFPGLLSAPTQPPLRSNKRVATSNPNKRKSSTDLSASQPPLKKMASDASKNSMGSAAPVAGNMPGCMGGFSVQLPDPSMMQASSSADGIAAAGAIRRDQGQGGNHHAQRASAVLRQAWKEDQDTGHLLESLHGVFGEAILSFVQPSEISFFL